MPPVELMNRDGYNFSDTVMFVLYGMQPKKHSTPQPPLQS